MMPPIAKISALAAIGVLAAAGAAIYFNNPSGPDRLAESGLKAPDTEIVTGTIPGERPEPEAPSPPTPQEALGLALEALDDARIDDVHDHAKTLEAGSLERDVLDWALAMSGNSGSSANFIAETAKRLADWPGQITMRNNQERAIARGFFAERRLKAFLGDDAPQTINGAMVVAQAAARDGDTEAARALLMPFWADDVLHRSLETRIPQMFSDVLTTEDHDKRYVNMMARDRIRAGSRIVEHTRYGALHDAWSAVIRNQRNAGDLIAEIPEELTGSEAALFLRIAHLRRRGMMSEAAKLFAELDRDTELSNPDAWWTERRIVSRSLREEGDFQTAYDIAAAHSGGTPATEVAAAFHAGWYALRGLDDPVRAAEHFARIETIAKGAASLSRGAYWLGRSYQASGEDDIAKAQFERAARFSTHYHGQLALAELGRPLQTITAPDADGSAERPLQDERLFQAAMLLHSLDQTRRTYTLFYGLADRGLPPQHLAWLTNRLASDGDHALALRIAKRAAWSAQGLGALAHPVGAIPKLDDVPAPDMALAYSIARQESEFNIAAVSRANARGLLQLLPSTARDVAQRLDIPFESARLTTDAAYNATLGREYLDEQMDRFGGSYVLTFIAYNAGPGRARQWLERFGDPRGKPLHEVIDWVEQIPFTETRGYVHKVMENLQVYKARLDADPDIERDLRFGRR